MDMAKHPAQAHAEGYGLHASGVIPVLRKRGRPPGPKWTPALEQKLLGIAESLSASGDYAAGGFPPARFLEEVSSEFNRVTSKHLLPKTACETLLRLLRRRQNGPPPARLSRRRPGAMRHDSPGAEPRPGVASAPHPCEDLEAAVKSYLHETPTPTGSITGGSGLAGSAASGAAAPCTGAAAGGYHDASDADASDADSCSSSRNDTMELDETASNLSFTSGIPAPRHANARFARVPIDNTDHPSHSSRQVSAIEQAIPAVADGALEPRAEPGAKPPPIQDALLMLVDGARRNRTRMQNLPVGLVTRLPAATTSSAAGNTPVVVQSHGLPVMFSGGPWARDAGIPVELDGRGRAAGGGCQWTSSELQVVSQFGSRVLVAATTGTSSNSLPRTVRTADGPGAMPGDGQLEEQSVSVDTEADAHPAFLSGRRSRVGSKRARQGASERQLHWHDSDADFPCTPAPLQAVLRGPPPRDAYVPKHRVRLITTSEPVDAEVRDTGTGGNPHSHMNTRAQMGMEDGEGLWPDSEEHTSEPLGLWNPRTAPRAAQQIPLSRDSVATALGQLPADTHRSSAASASMFSGQPSCSPPAAGVAVAHATVGGRVGPCQAGSTAAVSDEVMGSGQRTAVPVLLPASSHALTGSAVSTVESPVLQSNAHGGDGFLPSVQELPRSVAASAQAPPSAAVSLHVDQRSEPQQQSRTPHQVHADALRLPTEASAPQAAPWPQAPVPPRSAGDLNTAGILDVRAAGSNVGSVVSMSRPATQSREAGTLAASAASAVRHAHLSSAATAPGGYTSAAARTDGAAISRETMLDVIIRYATSPPQQLVQRKDIVMELRKIRDQLEPGPAGILSRSFDGLAGMGDTEWTESWKSVLPIYLQQILELPPIGSDDQDRFFTFLCTSALASTEWVAKQDIIISHLGCIVSKALVAHAGQHDVAVALARVSDNLFQLVDASSEDWDQRRVEIVKQLLKCHVQICKARMS